MQQTCENIPRNEDCRMPKNRYCRDEKCGEKDCFVIEFANRIDVLKFLNYIYQDDFVVLKRKYLKYKALRLELEENGEGAIKQ